MRVAVCANNRMDLGVKTWGRMFCDVLQIQLNTGLYSLFTALQRAHEEECRFPAKAYSCLLVSQVVISPLIFSQNLALVESVLSCLFCTIGVYVG